mmetsp:Transcript_14332/g.32063  ORF Transcript_14332/g.32063 Transcript_14332/m.32063 type:complete len:226 (+) Transcript_14332:183-860(+)
MWLSAAWSCSRDGRSARDGSAVSLFPFSHSCLSSGKHIPPSGNATSAFSYRMSVSSIRQSLSPSAELSALRPRSRCVSCVRFLISGGTSDRRLSSASSSVSFSTLSKNSSGNFEIVLFSGIFRSVRFVSRMRVDGSPDSSFRERSKSVSREHIPMAASMDAMRFEDRFSTSIESFAPMFSGMRRILFFERSTLIAPYAPWSPFSLGGRSTSSSTSIGYDPSSRSE